MKIRTRDCIIYAFATNEPNELQQCILLGASYVQRIVHALNERFPNLPVFNATKLFSSCSYSSDDSDRIINTKLWLERILMRFQYIKEESDMYKKNFLEFTEKLRHECENKMIFEA